jgi:hypothetical protein
MATLTTKARKKLSDSAFCGPGRTYPVPDISHARNALARVAQFGTEAEQSRVRRCVEKKFPSLKKAE